MTKGNEQRFLSLNILKKKFYRRKCFSNEKLASALQLYSKMEYFVSVAALVMFSIIFSSIAIGNFFVDMNEHQLPFNFFIIWLPFDKVYSINWMLNYSFQILSFLFACAMFIIYFLLVVSIVNYSCWIFDELITFAESLNPSAELVSSNTERCSRTETLNKFIMRSQEVFKLHNDARNILQSYFFVELTLLSFVLCFSCYTTLKAGGSIFSNLLMMTALAQLFSLCWMGNRVVVRIEKFASSIYGVQWYWMSAKQRRVINLILLMTQKIEGFHGIFNGVGMETFLKVRKT